VRGILAALGSASIEGPAVSWVADHRKHHAFADVYRRDSGRV
jgi:stearoyl-CoA desaturase (delta-9 desaturase)